MTVPKRSGRPADDVARELLDALDSWFHQVVSSA
jgi:hypothetical protein